MSPGATARSDTAAGRAPAAALTGVSFVTGGAGFAGRHLVELLGLEGLEPAAPSSADVDLLDRAAVEAALRAVAPTAIFHLAAFSSPQLSWRQPEQALLSNLEMTLNVLESARAAAPEAHLVIVASGQVYGEPESMPVTEEARLQPGNPYAVSKAACDMLGHQYARSHGMHVVRVRPFNHAGPGQPDDYVVSTLARQVAEAEHAGHDAVLRTGDVQVQRDFTDVRDVVRAYLLAASLEPGAYNVCSGRCTSIADLIDVLADEAEVTVRQETDPARLRPHEPPALRGSYDRLSAATGWKPEIPLAQTVRDTLDWWRGQLPRPN
jgi:GDP-4-dehydro-6-deoxy-D-mannose reductase